jgi:capsular polysaccharide biosynthesis protein
MKFREQASFKCVLVANSSSTKVEHASISTSNIGDRVVRGPNSHVSDLIYFSSRFGTMRQLVNMENNLIKLIAKTITLKFFNLYN